MVFPQGAHGPPESLHGPMKQNNSAAANSAIAKGKTPSRAADSAIPKVRVNFLGKKNHGMVYRQLGHQLGGGQLPGRRTLKLQGEGQLGVGDQLAKRGRPCSRTIPFIKGTGGPKKANDDLQKTNAKKWKEKNAKKIVSNSLPRFLMQK